MSDEVFGLSIVVGGSAAPTANREMTLAARDFVENVMSSRQDFMNKFIDPRRSIRDECGYPDTISTDQYREFWEREAVAARVVEVMPKESWQTQPDVFEDDDAEKVTDFEQAWMDLNKSLRGQSWHKQDEEQGGLVWEALKRADILSGIGQYGVLLIGIDDGLELDQPIAGVNAKGEFGEPKGTERKLIYLRAFDEKLAQITQCETNKKSPRYGQPTEYLLTLNDPTNTSTTGIGYTTATVKVHWSRCIHICDVGNQAGSSEVFSPPRMKAVWDRLCDIRKLYGGSAEMYWRGAFPGLSIEINPDFAAAQQGLTPAEKSGFREQANQYQNTLQRYLLMVGATAKSLAPQVSDPTPQIDVQLTAICIKLGCPKRVFMGSERGELASSQDDGAWNDRLRERQHLYITPRIIVPFVDRLIVMGVLPVPEEYSIVWPDLESLTDGEKAAVAVQQTQAITTYVSGGGEQLIAPIDYLTRILQMPQSEAQQILDTTTEHMDDVKEEQAQQAADEAAAMAEQGVQQHQMGLEKLDAQTQGQIAVKQAPGKPAFGKKPTANADDLPEAVIDNTFCPTGPGGGVDPTCSPGSSRAFGGATRFPKPHELAGLKVLKTLPGSTGAKLVEDKHGNKFVMKTHDKAHLQNEVDADAVYRALGIAVPNSKLLETPDGKHVKLSEFLEGGKTLSDWEADTKHASQTDIKAPVAKHAIKAMHDKFSKGFAADALLANWDVVGLSKDNIMIKDGVPYRIDNGGAMLYRAQGSPKGVAFGAHVTETATLKNASTNKTAADVFKNVSHEDIKNQVQHLVDNKNEILGKINDPKAFDIIDQRINNLKTQFLTPTAAPVKSVPVVPQVAKATTTPSATGHLASAESLGNHIQTHPSAKGAVTQLQIAKIKHMNPNGIENGVMYIPMKSTKKPEQQAFVDSVAAIVPPGTVLKTKYISSEHMAAGVPSHQLPDTPKALKPGSKPPKESKKTDSGVPVSAPAPSSTYKTPTELFMEAKAAKAAAASPASSAHSSIPLGIGVKQGGVFVPPSKKLAEPVTALKAWEAKLTSSEKSVVSDWKGSSSELRKKFGKGLAATDPDCIKFNSALDKAPSAKQGTIYRGQSVGYGTDSYGAKLIKTLTTIGVSGEWSDDAPHSCSRSKSKSHQFAGNGGIMMVIHTKKDSTVKHIESIPPHVGEEELIGRHTTKYRIKSLHEMATMQGTGNYKLIVEFEEI